MAAPKGPSLPRARPIRTLYSRLPVKPKGSIPDPAKCDRIAHSATPKNAARAAFRRLIDNEYVQAHILGESGRPVAMLESYTFTTDTKLSVFDKEGFK